MGRLVCCAASHSLLSYCLLFQVPAYISKNILYFLTFYQFAPCTRPFLPFSARHFQWLRIALVGCSQFPYPRQGGARWQRSTETGARKLEAVRTAVQILHAQRTDFFGLELEQQSMLNTRTCCARTRVPPPLPFVGRHGEAWLHRLPAGAEVRARAEVGVAQQQRLWEA